MPQSFDERRERAVRAGLGLLRLLRHPVEQLQRGNRGGLALLREDQRHFLRRQRGVEHARLFQPGDLVDRKGANLRDRALQQGEQPVLPRGLLVRCRAEQGEEFDHPRLGIAQHLVGGEAFEGEVDQRVPIKLAALRQRHQCLGEGAAAGVPPGRRVLLEGFTVDPEEIGHIVDQFGPGAEQADEVELWPVCWSPKRRGMQIDDFIRDPCREFVHGRPGANAGGDPFENRIRIDLTPGPATAIIGLQPLRQPGRLAFLQDDRQRLTVDIGLDLGLARPVQRAQCHDGVSGAGIGGGHGAAPVFGFEVGEVVRHVFGNHGRGLGARLQCGEIGEQLLRRRSEGGAFAFGHAVEGPRHPDISIGALSEDELFQFFRRHAWAPSAISKLMICAARMCLQGPRWP